MEESRRVDYNVENISTLMKEEQFGIHVSLLQNGMDEDGRAEMSVVVESDLNAKTVKSILEELLKQYEEVNSD